MIWRHFVMFVDAFDEILKLIITNSVTMMLKMMTVLKKIMVVIVKLKKPQ